MEEDIFIQLYSEYFKIVYRYLYSLTFNQQKAEDLTQDVFIRAMCVLNVPDSRIKAWLLTVARNLYIDYIKKSSKITYTPEEVLMEHTSGDIQNELEDKHMLAAVIARLRMLPDTQRQAVVLCLVNELSYEEASEVMGLSVSAVTNLIYRARKNLRALRRSQDE